MNVLMHKKVKPKSNILQSRTGIALFVTLLIVIIIGIAKIFY